MELNNDNRWKTRQELTYALMDLLRKWVNLIFLYLTRLDLITYTNMSTINLLILSTAISH